MVELSKKEYRQIACDYLKNIKHVTLQIQSLKRDIQRVKSDIVALSAIVYSKDKVDGGTPTGIEDDINRLLMVEAKAREQIHSLLLQRENARELINSLTEVIGRVILTQEYINGMSTKGAFSFVGYSGTQGKEYKNLALIELGYKLRPLSTYSDL